MQFHASVTRCSSVDHRPQQHSAMDKYTVDLDQVLNDFEYSELTTEQQQQQEHQEQPPEAYRPYGLAKSYSTVKHSINNVFNSLNEYLNSGIGPEEVPPPPETSNATIATTTPVKEKPLESLIDQPISLKVGLDDGKLEFELDPDEEEEEEELQEEEEQYQVLIDTVVEETEVEVKEEQLIGDVVDVEEKTELVHCDSSNPPKEQEEQQQQEEVKIGFQLEVDDEEAAKYLAELDEHLDLLEEEEVNDEATFHDVEEIPPDSQLAVEDEEHHKEDENSPEVERPSPHNGGEEAHAAEEEQESKDGIVEDSSTESMQHLNLAQREEHEHATSVVEKKVQQVHDELQRPNSLDFMDVAREETVNTIGNPGSTPYNNLYTITKSAEAGVQPPANININVPPANRYESESSASVSPTFSEASTDSVRSTDSPARAPQTNEANADEGHGSEEEQDDEEEEEEEDDEEQDQEHEFHDAHDNSSNHERGEGDGGEFMNQEEDETLSLPVEVEVTDGDAAPTIDEGNNGERYPLPGEEPIYVDVDSINQGQEESVWLGKRAPLWIPDADALNCQHCELKFTVIKRRHHCRACGLVLCSKCCNMKHRLAYMNDTEARVCTRCHELLANGDGGGGADSGSGSGDSQHSTPSRTPAAEAAAGQPNPNNPMEYCSVVPPHQQAEHAPPPSVMVPVGVLKRKGSNKKHNKSVMFCDGIRPGSDLTNLDNDFNYNEKTPAADATTVVMERTSKASAAGSAKRSPAVAAVVARLQKNLPTVDPVTQSFIPENENCLPPTVALHMADITYTECGNNANVVEMLKNETLTFAVQRNLHIHVRLITMDCCINKQAWCFSTEGLISVGQDEIVILLECIENETQVPKDVFHHLNNIYNSAVKGTTVTELGLSIHPTTNFLDSRNHAGFIFLRPSFQCLQNVIIPKEPYLVGVLVHRWETPWARIFPLRLVLRLGAEYRYYPAPLISTRHRDSVFVEIGHTIINLLADFRNFSYTLPNIRGLTIHMEEKSTTVAIPVNRYDQVMKSISNSSEHILAFGGNFSAAADSHLVCIQDTQGSNENNYKTHAINIQNKARKVTGASFIVFNGALKSSSGLTAKSSIVEDGLMIQIPPEHMIQVRESLRNMKNYTIQCGCVNAESDETVNIIWSEADVNFNVGVKSSVDGQALSGVPSIRVHNGKDYTCTSGARLIRWTEVFLLQNGEENARTQEPVDISKVAESISKATCQALVKYLDLLATNHFMKIGIRTTLHVDDVSYSAGSNGVKLPPIYMKSLDNELVPVLHRITSSGNVGDGTIVLELIFRILNV